MEETPLVTPVDPNTLDTQNQVVESKPTSVIYVWFLVVVIAGLLTGFLLSKGKSGSAGSSTLAGGKDIVDTKNEVGSTDTKTFRDTATGKIEIGGLNGEGTHKLIRDGGPSQTVYLVSSVIDLDQYAGKKVEVWGETLKAKKVGWLMDVGRLKIQE
jgi:hypothetical protein